MGLKINFKTLILPPVSWLRLNKRGFVFWKDGYLPVKIYKILQFVEDSFCLFDDSRFYHSLFYIVKGLIFLDDSSLPGAGGMAPVLIFIFGSVTT